METKPIQLANEYRESLGQLLDLSDTQKERLKKRLKKEIENWKNDSSGLQAKLKSWNELVENVVEETDYPFVGCSNIHIPLVAIYMKVYNSILRRSSLGAGIIWYSETEDDNLRDLLPQIDESMNYKAFSKWNISEGLSDVYWTTCRDGL